MDKEICRFWSISLQGFFFFNKQKKENVYIWRKKQPNGKEVYLRGTPAQLPLPLAILPPLLSTSFSTPGVSSNFPADASTQVPYCASLPLSSTTRLFSTLHNKILKSMKKLLAYFHSIFFLLLPDLLLGSEDEGVRRK